MDYTLPTWLHRGVDDAILCLTQADADAALAQGYTDSPIRRRGARRNPSASPELTADEPSDVPAEG